MPPRAKSKVTIKSSVSNRRTSKDEQKKHNRKKTDIFSIYIYRVLKHVHPDMGISTKAMDVMNSFLKDMFNRIASEASCLVQCSKRSTLTSREIHTAVNFILPGELAKHAVGEGSKAVTKYTTSK